MMQNLENWRLASADLYLYLCGQRPAEQDRGTTQALFRAGTEATRILGRRMGPYLAGK